VKEFNSKYKVDLNEDKKALSRLQTVCEKSKLQLSTSN
jgi:molecular chaperone DnaK (HSP70)